MSYEWGGDGNWTAYTADVNELLVAANSSGKQEIEVYMGSCDYVISLSQMRQRQKHNPTKTRRVRWNDNATPKPAAQGGSSTRGLPMPRKNHQSVALSGHQGVDGCSSRSHSTQSSTHSPGQTHSSPSASQSEDAEELLEWPVYTLSINGAPHAHVPDPRNPDIVLQYPIYRLPVDHASHPNVPVIVYEGVHYLVKDKGPLPAAATNTSAVPDLRGDSSLQPFQPQYHTHASQHNYGERGGSYIHGTSTLSPSSYSSYSPSRHQTTKGEQHSPNRGPTYHEAIESRRGEYPSPYPFHVGQSAYSGSSQTEYRDSSQIPFSRDKSPVSSSDSPTWSHVYSYEPRQYGDSSYRHSDVSQSHSHAEQGYQSFDPRFQTPPQTYPSAYSNYPQSHTAESFERLVVGGANGRSYFATAAERYQYGASQGQAFKTAENYDSYPIRGTGLDHCAPASYYAPAGQQM